MELKECLNYGTKMAVSQVHPTIVVVVVVVGGGGGGGGRGGFCCH